MCCQDLHGVLGKVLGWLPAAKRDIRWTTPRSKIRKSCLVALPLAEPSLRGLAGAKQLAENTIRCSERMNHKETQGLRSEF